MYNEPMFAQNIEGKLPQPGRREKAAMAIRALFKKESRIIPATGRESKVGTPEYERARQAFFDAVEEAFKLHDEGRFYPQRNPIYGQDSQGYGYEFLTLPADKTAGLPEVKLEINRTYRTELEDYKAGKTGYPELYATEPLLASYGVQGDVANGLHLSYKFNGYFEEPFTYESLAGGHGVHDVRPIEEVTAEIRQLNTFATQPIAA